MAKKAVANVERSFDGLTLIETTDRQAQKILTSSGRRLLSEAETLLGLHRSLLEGDGDPRLRVGVTRYSRPAATRRAETLRAAEASSHRATGQEDGQEGNTPETLRQIVVRMAKETGWGYGRIVGELKKLRIQCVSRTTVRKILKEEEVSPSPKRRKGNWAEVVKIHAETLWRVDFLRQDGGNEDRLKQALVMAFVHVESRRVICSPATLKADDAWMVT